MPFIAKCSGERPCCWDGPEAEGISVSSSRSTAERASDHISCKGLFVGVLLDDVSMLDDILQGRTIIVIKSEAEAEAEARVTFLSRVLPVAEMNCFLR